MRGSRRKKRHIAEDLLSRYAARYLITTWVLIWFACAAVAPYLFSEYPQTLRLMIALGFILGSVAGETLFLPLVIRERMLAFGFTIFAGILANLLMGFAFLTLFLGDSAVVRGTERTIFYTLMLPSAVIWFSGGMYLAISRFFPVMRDTHLSLRPWQSSGSSSREKLERIEEKQDEDLEQQRQMKANQEQIMEKLEDLETKVEGDERRKAD